MVAASVAGHRLWRNNTAKAWVGVYFNRLPDGTVTLKNARLLHAGLCVGSSDCIGLTKSGVFAAVEFKSSRGRARPEQVKFIATVRRLGGFAGISRSVQDTMDILDGKIRD